MTAPNEYADLADCAVRLRAEAPAVPGCVWCEGPLTGRQLRWCSKACVDAYLRNHAWTDARRLAVERATVKVTGWLYWIICDGCGRHTAAPEVNHVDPRRGAGYGSGCWNHQTNLQVLCHACHVDETYRQQRGFGRPAPGARPEPLWAATA